MKKASILFRHFCYRMQTRRIEKNISQLELAEILDCHINTISNIENGRNQPNLEMALKLSKILDISLDEMVEKVAKNIKL